MMSTDPDASPGYCEYIQDPLNKITTIFCECGRKFKVEGMAGASIFCPKCGKPHYITLYIEVDEEEKENER